MGCHMLQDIKPRTPALCGSSLAKRSCRFRNASTKSFNAHRTYNLQVLPNRKLLEFLANDDSGQLTGPVIFDVPDLPRIFLPLQAKNGNTSFVHISGSGMNLGDSVIFDTQSCTFYKFPIFNMVRWCMPFSRKPLYTHRELPAPFRKGRAYQVTHHCTLRQSIFRQGAAGTGVHASR